MLTVTERDAGPKYAEINAFLAKIPIFPWLKPAPNLDVKVVECLVREHLRCLTAHSSKDFSHVTLRVVRSVAEYDAAWDAARNAARYAAYDAAWDAAYGAAYGAAWYAARNAARNAAWNAAWDAAYNAARDAAWGVARDAAYNAAYDAACNATYNAGHMVSGLTNNPWAPLCDIMALGALPIGVIDNAFVVWIP